MGKNFIDLLTKKDVTNILRLNNLAINYELPCPYEKIKDEDGNSYYFLKCKTINNEESENIDWGKAAGSVLAGLTAMAGALAGPYFDYDKKIIVIKDFYMAELFSIKPEDEALEYNGYLTNNYANYMLNKFGDKYKTARTNFFVKAIKKERSDEPTK